MREYQATWYPKCHIASASDAHTRSLAFSQYLYITYCELSLLINGPDRNYFPTAWFLFHLYFLFSFSPSHKLFFFLYSFAVHR